MFYKVYKWKLELFYFWLLNYISLNVAQQWNKDAWMDHPYPAFM